MKHRSIDVYALLSALFGYFGIHYLYMGWFGAAVIRFLFSFAVRALCAVLHSFAPFGAYLLLGVLEGTYTLVRSQPLIHGEASRSMFGERKGKAAFVVTSCVMVLAAIASLCVLITPYSLCTECRW